MWLTVAGIGRDDEAEEAAPGDEEVEDEQEPEGEELINSEEVCHHMAYKSFQQIEVYFMLTTKSIFIYCLQMR